MRRYAVRYRAGPGTVLDAVVQAVIMVACIHAVLFQLYVIPTESMVPKFLVHDRVIVTKAQSGPRIPLSPVKLPSLTAPKRGSSSSAPIKSIPASVHMPITGQPGLVRWLMVKKA